MLCVEEVDKRRLVSSGEGLKYPAVNVQEEVLYLGDESVRRRVRRRGSSVEVSGVRRGVSCEIGYIVVFGLRDEGLVVFREVEKRAEDDDDLISVDRILLELDMYSLGDASGDGAWFEDGHSSI